MFAITFHTILFIIWSQPVLNQCNQERIICSKELAYNSQIEYLFQGHGLKEAIWLQKDVSFWRKEKMCT